MFEFDKYHGPQSSPTRPATPYTPRPLPEKRAFLLWGEHCVECAAPDCFVTCDLYSPRPDKRCRRFEFGIFRNAAFPSASGCGAEVRFKKWGKLEARGNATMLPSQRVAQMERVGNWASRALNPVGLAMSGLTSDIRWSYVSFGALERLNRQIARRRNPQVLPTAFVAEIYNPGDRTQELRLGMSVDRSALGRALTADQLPPAFTQLLVLTPGYNCQSIPFDAFRPIIESDLPFNVSLSPTTEDAHLVFLTLDFVSGGTEPITLPATKPEADPAPARRPAAKCVVFDLDNTLWDGVLVEGHVQLRPGVLDLFKALDQRGILISVASKNSHDEAIAELSKLGLEEYVLFPQISWGMKSSAIKEIAKSIDIGIDTLVFVDDSPFERAEVERTFPEVEVLPDTELPRILDHVRLQGSTTAEAASRRLMYRQSMARASASVAFGDDYMTFLRSCQIVLEIRPDRPADFERIAELVQRTNQLNFSGRKYSREEISAALADPALERYVLSVDDRFGSYGLVGFCMAVRTQDEVLVKDFMLSCRVQGKFVEQALFHHLTNRPGWTASAIAVNFKGTSRNRLAEAVLDKLGFSSDQGQPRRRPAGKDAFAVDFLEVRSHWFNMESESA